ncbi:SOS response-associated peptidase [Petrimonas sp.]|uniref:SOS response-associated peptidase n=1 Tax=Petrimonas sp. TaxID=2023866 RepID=UPI003F510E2F
MCFTVSVEKRAKEAIREYLKSNEGVQMKFNFEDDFYLVSGFSHPKMPIIKQGVIELSEWGLIPSFAVNEEKANELANMTLNARSDTVHEKPSFRKSIKTQRCILVVDGFFEWRHEDGKKIPFYIHPKDNTVFYLGCIYNSWVNKLTGEVKDTFSIITTDANELMEYVHNSKKRMPLILNKSDISKWINPTTEINIVNTLMQPYKTGQMEAYQISKDAGNSRLNRNIPEIKNKVKYPELDDKELTLF